MTAAELAKQAALSTAPYIKAVSSEVAHQLELAFVARWIDQQDDSINPATILKTARSAMDELRRIYEQNY